MSASVRLQQADFSVDQELSELRSGSGRIGGIATFVGCARDFSEGRVITQISFDAYDQMALAEMNTLRKDAIDKFELIDARIVHRTGVVAAGEQIVLIITGAEHRVAALQACHWLIDELKLRVPIWKKEITSAGDVLVTPHP